MSSRTSLIMVALVSCIAGLSNAASAAGGTTLYVDDSVGLDGDGRSWATAFVFLQDALAAAQAGSGVSEIRIGQGTYRPDRSSGTPGGSGMLTASFHVVDGVAVRGGFAGVVAADPDVRNPHLHPTVLSGDLFGNDASGAAAGVPGLTDNAYHVISAGGLREVTEWSGLIVTGGHFRPAGPGLGGAGLHLADGHLILSDCTFVNNLNTALNVPNGGGGAIHVTNGNLELIRCVFDHNRTGYPSGSSLWNGGAVFADLSTVTVRDCLFRDNVGAHGGGLDLQRSAADVRDSVFIDNLGGGGAMRVATSAEATIVGCIFDGNRRLAGSSGAHGGTLYFTGTGGTTADGHLVDCVISNGEANRGGAIYTAGNVELIVDQCVIHHCTANVGGAIAVWGGDVVVRQSTVADNVAQNANGGGAGRTDAGTLTFTNSVVWGNLPQAFVQAYVTLPVEASWCIVNGGWPGDVVMDVDPRFVDAATADYRLQKDSPAINAGNDDFIPPDTLDIDDDGDTDEALPLDLMGLARIVDGSLRPALTPLRTWLVDMGAHERPAP
ncbi:MAG: hypothetical protein KDA25_00740 [Phycisphaerales bacterium]|nr:hypothetical protein [Phycisphaerales bacterium]